VKRVALAAAALVSACAMLDKAAPVATAPSSTSLSGRSNADELVLYMAGLRGMSDAALTAEASRQKQAAGRDNTDLGRVKAALALTLAHPADETEILALLEPVTRRETTGPDLRTMAGFLQVIVVDRRRLRESAAAAGGRLRDERRAFEAQKQRAEALQERAAQLQQKLDALTELEKSLSDRQPPSSSR
jgi:hypothetical protein